MLLPRSCFLACLLNRLLSVIVFCFSWEGFRLFQTQYLCRAFRRGRQWKVKFNGDVEWIITWEIFSRHIHEVHLPSCFPNVLKDRRCVCWGFHSQGRGLWRQPTLPPSSQCRLLWVLQNRSNQSMMPLFSLVSHEDTLCCDVRTRLHPEMGTAAFAEEVHVPRHSVWCLRVVVLLTGRCFCVYASLAQKLAVLALGLGKM